MAIFYNYTITVDGNKATMDKNIYLYRKNKNVDYYFEIKLNNFFCGKRCAKCKNVYRYNETERIEQVLNRINNEDLHYSFLGLVDDYKN